MLERYHQALKIIRDERPEIPMRYSLLHEVIWPGDELLQAQRERESSMTKDEAEARGWTIFEAEPARRLRNAVEPGLLVAEKIIDGVRVSQEAHSESQLLEAVEQYEAQREAKAGEPNTLLLPEDEQVEGLGDRKQEAKREAEQARVLAGQSVDDPLREE